MIDNIKSGVFLDRDGVINKAIIKNGLPYPPQDISEFEIIDGIEEAIKDLKKNNFFLAVVTNQPDVARGSMPIENVDEIHEYLMNNFPIDHIQCCTHDNNDNCLCRKPKPGMLKDIAKKFNIDLKKSYMIGDRWKDIEAGKAAKCTTILVGEKYDEKFSLPDKQFKNLLEASNWILTKT